MSWSSSLMEDGNGNVDVSMSRSLESFLETFMSLEFEGPQVYEIFGLNMAAISLESNPDESATQVDNFSVAFWSREMSFVMSEVEWLGLFQLVVVNTSFWFRSMYSKGSSRKTFFFAVYLPIAWECARINSVVNLSCSPSMYCAEGAIFIVFSDSE